MHAGGHQYMICTIIVDPRLLTKAGGYVISNIDKYLYVICIYSIRNKISSIIE